MSDKQKYLKRLEKGFDSFNKLVVPRFVKGPYDDEVTTGYIERYLKLLAALIEQLPRHAVDKYIEAYGDILKDIIEKDKGESKTTYIDVFTSEYQNLLDTFLTVETGEEARNKRRVLMERGNSEEMEINRESVRRLNELFTVFAKTSKELDINVVKHLLEIYTRTVDTFIYEGVSVEAFSLTADLEDIFDTYALKDRLNEIRLEIGDLTDDEIQDSLDTLDRDITRLLDTDWGEDDIAQGKHETPEAVSDDVNDYDLDYEDEFSPREAPTKPKAETVVTKQDTDTQTNEVVEAPVEENLEEKQEESQDEVYEEETYDDIQVEQTNSEPKQEHQGDTDISHMLDEEDLKQVSTEEEVVQEEVVQEEVTEDNVVGTAEQAGTQTDEEEIEIEDDADAETEFEAEEESEFEEVTDAIPENLLETEPEEPEETELEETEAEPEKKEESFNIKNFFQN